MEILLIPIVADALRWIAASVLLRIHPRIKSIVLGPFWSGSLSVNMQDQVGIDDLKKILSDKSLQASVESLLAEYGYFAENDTRLSNECTWQHGPFRTTPIVPQRKFTCASSEHSDSAHPQGATTVQNSSSRHARRMVDVWITDTHPRAEPGQAITAHGSDLYGRNITLISPIDSTRRIEVQASNDFGIAFPFSSSNSPQLILCSEDASKIFDLPMQTIEKALAVY